MLPAPSSEPELHSNAAVERAHGRFRAAFFVFGGRRAFMRNPRGDR
jgi:hypothetical protein